MELYTHPSIPLQAPAHVWRAAGYTIHDNTNTVGFNANPDMDMLITLGTAHHPDNDMQAILWGVTEYRRRCEERTRVTALNREAAAISELAQTIKSTTEQTVMNRLLDKLSDKTRHAVRQQVGKVL